MDHKRNAREMYDVIGVGIGPFNLGLAALLQRAPELRCAFLDRKPEFDWHSGMMIEGTTLQVPFFADLVTMADPAHPLSFLSYLHDQGRLYHFYFLEKFHISRKEYNHYCRWAAGQLASCRFGHEVREVRLEEARGGFQVTAADLSTMGESTYYTKHLVLGVGSVPFIPMPLRVHAGSGVFHSAEYLRHRERCRSARSVTVIGSGQSAGEIVLDLLGTRSEPGFRLDWFTRSSGFLPMEYSKLGLEHFSPEYTRYFYRLPAVYKDELRKRQSLLYKGISARTIADIYDALYEAGAAGGSGPKVRLLANTEVLKLQPADGDGYRLLCRQCEQERSFEHQSDIVILATGYEHAEPACLRELEGILVRDDQGRLVINEDYSIRLRGNTSSRIFVQNGELHTHGVGAPDLGLGAYRSSIIVNRLAAREVYPQRERHVFQQFGVDE